MRPQRRDRLRGHAVALVAEVAAVEAGGPTTIFRRPAKRRVVQRLRVQVRVVRTARGRDVEQVRGFVVHVAGQLQFATRGQRHRVDAGQAATILGRARHGQAREVVVHRQDLRAVRSRDARLHQQELVVLRIEMRRRDAYLQVVGDQCLQFEFHALRGDLGGVVEHGLLELRAVLDGDDVGRALRVFVLRDEHRRVDAQTVVEPLGLETQFVVGRELRIHRTRQLRHENAAGARLVVVAAGLVAARHRQVRERVIVDFIRRGHAPARLGPLRLQVAEVERAAARAVVHAGRVRVVRDAVGGIERQAGVADEIRALHRRGEVRGRQTRVRRIQCAEAGLRAAGPFLLVLRIAEAGADREAIVDFPRAVDEAGQRIGLLRIAADLRGAVEHLSTEVLDQVDEAEQLDHAEACVIALEEAACDEVERAFEVRSNADLLLRGHALGVARGIEQRQRLAGDGVDRRSARIGVRQMFGLTAIAADRIQLVVAEIPFEVQVRAVDVDDLAVAHAEQRVIAIRRGHVVERIACRAGEAQCVPQVRCTRRRVVVRRHRIGAIAHHLELCEGREIVRDIPLRLHAARDDVLTTRCFAGAGA